MFWFIVLFFSIFIIYSITLLENLYKENNAVYLFEIICALFFLILMSLRKFTVGADTKEYVTAFQQISALKWGNIFTTPIVDYGGGSYIRLEGGYRLLNKIISLLSNNRQAIIIFISFLIIFLQFELFHKYSAFPIFSYWLYLTLGIFQTQMNLSRNTIAILICYLGSVYIYRHNFFKYLIVVCIAATIHNTALLFLPIYFLVNYFYKNRNASKYSNYIILVILILLPLIRPIVYRLVPATYSYLTQAQTNRLEGLLVGLFYVMIILIIISFVGRNKYQESLQQNMYLNCLFYVSIMFYCLGINIPFATRIATLFSMVMPVYIPDIINSIKIPFAQKKKIILFVSLICGLQFLFRLFINNIGGTLPYVFFWGK